MQLNSLSSFSPIDPRPAGAVAPKGPYAPPPTVLTADVAELGSAAPEANVYQAMTAAVAAPRDFTIARDNFVQLGRAKFDEPGPPPAVVAGRGDEAYVTAGAMLYRMAPDGTLTEMGKEKAGPLSAPVVDGEGRVYYKSRTGEVVAVSPEGKELWRTSTNGRSVQAHNEKVGVFPDGGVYALQLEGSNETVHALSREGKLEWSHKLEPGERLVGVGPNGTLFTEKLEDGGNRILQATQPNRWLGKRRWKVDGLSTKIPTAWVSPQGQAVVLKKDGTLAAVDADGKEKWTYKGSGIENVLTSPDGSTYVQEDQKRTLTSLSPAGAVARQDRSTSHLFEVAVGPDGTLYSIDTDQKITAQRPDGARTEAPYPFTDTSRLEVTPGGVVYSGTRRSTLPGLKAAPNEVVSFKVREPKAQAAAEPKGGLPEPTPTPEDGWIVIGGISLPVQQR